MDFSRKTPDWVKVSGKAAVAGVFIALLALFTDWYKIFKPDVSAPPSHAESPIHNTPILIDCTSVMQTFPEIDSNAGIKSRDDTSVPLQQKITTNPAKQNLLIDEAIDIGDYDKEDIASIITNKGISVTPLYVVSGILNIAIPKETTSVKINFSDGKEIVHKVRFNNL